MSPRRTSHWTLDTWFLLGSTLAWLGCDEATGRDAGHAGSAGIVATGGVKPIGSGGETGGGNHSGGAVDPGPAGATGSGGAEYGGNSAAVGTGGSGGTIPGSYPSNLIDCPATPAHCPCHYSQSPLTYCVDSGTGTTCVCMNSKWTCWGQASGGSAGAGSNPDDGRCLTMPATGGRPYGAGGAGEVSSGAIAGTEVAGGTPAGAGLPGAAGG